MAEDKPATTPAPKWIEIHDQIAAAIALLLMFLYVSPVLLIGMAWWGTGGFQDASFWFGWFAAFMKTSDTTLNEFHKVLLPVISGLSVVVFRKKPGWPFVALGVFTLLAFVAATFIGVVFDMKSVQDAISGLPDTIDLVQARGFFTRVQETLLMYLMILLGIGVANASES